jgi:hypothetical protein
MLDGASICHTSQTMDRGTRKYDAQSLPVGLTKDVLTTNRHPLPNMVQPVHMGQRRWL